MFSNSILSYADVRELLDRALASDRGLRVRLGTTGACHNLRQRMGYFRRLDRRENKKVYDDSHILHDRSQYDTLIFRIGQDEKGHYVDLVKASGDSFDTEEL